MQKMSIKKLSILGLVLMGASAVTAAIIPSKSDNDKSLQLNGSVTQLNTDDGFTCTMTNVANDAACHASTFDGGSNTTDAGGTEEANNFQTDDNTTLLDN